MIFIYLFFIAVVYFIYRLVRFFILKRYKKISYDGLNALGFSYDEKDAFFYANRNAWQKEFGYGHIYDVLAPYFNIIIDTEPVRFSYNNKNWLISFWKGQYGITVGAEIGVYNTEDKKVTKKTIYKPVKDYEMLGMSFVLYDGDKKIVDVEAVHWWLAAFKVGMFCNLKNLVMEVQVNFFNKEMLSAFLKAFRKLGYKEEDYKIVDNTLSFTFKKPRSRKVFTRNKISDYFIQRVNKKNIELYNKYVLEYLDLNGQDDSNNPDYLIINKLIPAFMRDNNNIFILNTLNDLRE